MNWSISYAWQAPPTEGASLSSSLSLSAEKGVMVWQDETWLVVWSGRLDNESALWPGDHPPLPQRLLALWQQSAEDGLALLLGAFAGLIYHRPSHRLLTFIDSMGEGALFYHHTPTHLLFATQEAFLLRQYPISAELDPQTVLHYFAWRVPHNGATFFRHIHTLLPAHRLIAQQGHATTAAYWQPEITDRYWHQSAETCVEQFRTTLQTAIACRLHPSAENGVLMSGGLDSTSIAAFARQITPQTPLHSFSWVFEQEKEANEQTYIEAMVQFGRLTPHLIQGDDRYPLHNIAKWPLDFASPFSDPFEGLHHAVYEQAQQQQIAHLLTGWGADDLYAGIEYWLIDLWRAGRYTEGVREWIEVGRRLGVRAPLTTLSLRAILQHTLTQTPQWQKWRAARLQPPAWLHPEAQAQLLPLDGYIPPIPPNVNRLWQFYALFKQTNAHLQLVKARQAAQFGLHLTHPYRDRRMVELMLNLPAFYFYHHSWGKWIARTALQGVQPEKVRTRRWRSSLQGVFLRGMTQHRFDDVCDLLYRPNALWRTFLTPSFIPPTPQQLRAKLQQSDDLQAILLWNCTLIELWRERFAHNEPSKLSTQFSAKSCIIQQYHSS